MTFIFLRIFFVALSIFVGRQIGMLFVVNNINYGLLGAGIGGGLSLLIIIFELSTRNISVRGLSASVFGLLFGIIMAKMVADAISLIPMGEQADTIIPASRVILTLIFSYLGMTMAMRGRDEFNVIIPYVKFTRQNQHEDKILLDTSVIIDGRIADICETGFLENKFILPKFVLKELHYISDSQDTMKRARGRRGLDVLNRMQKNKQVSIKIYEDDFNDITEVDEKLVRLAKLLNAKIFTNDFNLNKIATIQNVGVLNINELANALKPVVIPGETMTVKLVKEGKEHNQAVGYLDDGTMVVVDNAKHLVGESFEVSVTSVLQTAAGRMIFAKIENIPKENR